MKMSDGVEQAIHSVAMLAGLQSNGVLSAGALAEFHGVSTSYLLKHLQALSGAGLLIAQPGPTGGYRLARTPDQITLLDVVLAVEGNAPAFRCSEIRQRGPNPLPGKPTAPCGINAAMLRAERVYRDELAKVSIADVLGDLRTTDTDGAIAARGCAFLELNERRRNIS
ncbi:Rrf2 family transcriptional regulator [Tardiphaga sp. P9-11]|jgi:Rrf2 family protein|uniref:RrF2 family transcriptional regulator n=1 Tax=Tardiphaga sp. P9-11 TaxID=2024614 RepID=UPI0011F1EE63|nr:Rrf2 family transcriptional regulator [Tardiphaga sp. P9-11]KAA0076487.1 Rrf2 family transcriptional regulator [Tardiphaga sp. P9-11]